jgi:hypothetical protein
MRAQTRLRRCDLATGLKPAGGGPDSPLAGTALERMPYAVPDCTWRGLSMPKLLEFDVDGGTALFEAPAGAGEITAVSKTGEVVEKISRSLGELLGIVGIIAKGFSEAIKDAPVETANLEFGLQFTAKGRLYVVDLAAQSAIKVTLTVTPGK